MKLLLQLIAKITPTLEPWLPDGTILLHWCHKYIQHGMAVPPLIGAVTQAVVTTEAATDILTTSFTANGTHVQTDAETTNITERGFAYFSGSVGDPTTADTTEFETGDFIAGETAVSFNRLISGLTDDTSYRVRAYAINSVGTAYGDTITVTTAGTGSLYWTDFSEYTTNQQPNDWTARYGDFVWKVSEEPDVTGGKFLECEAAATNGRNALTWDKVGDADRADVETLKRVRFPLSLETEIHSFTRGSSTAAASVHGYRHGLAPARPDNQIRITKFVDGTHSIVASTTQVLVTNTWYWLRSRVQGSNLYLKFWSGSVNDEHVEWTLTANDTSITGTGWVGLFRFVLGPVDVDYFSVATGGLTAPAPSEPPPTTPIFRVISLDADITAKKVDATTTIISKSADITLTDTSSNIDVIRKEGTTAPIAKIADTNNIEADSDITITKLDAINKSQNLIV